MPKIISITIICLMLFACGDDGSQSELNRTGMDPSKPLSWGKNQVVYVFCDDELWDACQVNLRNCLEQLRFTTKNEKYFELIRADYLEMDLFYKYRNLIFLGDVNSDKTISDYINKTVTSSVVNTVKTDGLGIFTRENLWARDQLVVFLLGSDTPHLNKLITHQSVEIHNIFVDKLSIRLARKVYSRPVYKKRFFAQLPFSLDLPVNYKKYKINMEKRQYSYIYRRDKDGFDRYISVYWEPMDTDTIDVNWLKETRKKFAWDIYDEDYFKDIDVRTELAKIAGYNSTKLSGRWRNEKYFMGGAFQAWAFFDPTKKLAIMIDTSVYYPAGAKIPALLELENIANSFQIK